MPKSAAASAARSRSNIPTSPTPWCRRRPTSRRRPARHAARRRPRLPDEHGRQAQAPAYTKANTKGRTIAVRHIAEVLAGELKDPAHRRRADEPTDLPRLQGQFARQRSPTAQLQQALSGLKGGLVAPRARSARRTARVRGPPRRRPRHQEPHARASRPLSRSLREKARPPSGANVHFAPTADDARDIILDICREADAQAGHQGQVDDLGGDRPQRSPRSGRPRSRRDRSWRIPRPDPQARRRATSSRPPST